MIQYKHIVKSPGYIKLGGKPITMPGMATNVKQALRMYRDGSFVEKAGAYYEEEGMPIPNFDRMSKIDRLMALNEVRERMISKKKSLDEMNSKAKAIYEDLEKQKQDVRESTGNDHSGNAGTNSGQGTAAKN